MINTSFYIDFILRIEISKIFNYTFLIDFISSQKAPDLLLIEDWSSVEVLVEQLVSGCDPSTLSGMVLNQIHTKKYKC